LANIVRSTGVVKSSKLLALKVGAPTWCVGPMMAMRSCSCQDLKPSVCPGGIGVDRFLSARLVHGSPFASGGGEARNICQQLGTPLESQNIGGSLGPRTPRRLTLPRSPVARGRISGRNCCLTATASTLSSSLRRGGLPQNDHGCLSGDLRANRVDIEDSESSQEAGTSCGQWPRGPGNPNRFDTPES
jgi:hypothetical protein